MPILYGAVAYREHLIPQHEAKIASWDFQKRYPHPIACPKGAYRRNSSAAGCARSDRYVRLSMMSAITSYLFACARNFAHRFFAAFEIFAFAAADNTRFLIPTISRLVVSPSAFAAARTPFNWF